MRRSYNPMAGRWTLRKLVRDIIAVKGENGRIPFRQLYGELRDAGFYFSQREFHNMFRSLRLAMDEDSENVRAL